MSLQVRQESFQQLQDEWKALARAAPAGGPFVTPAWLQAWWESCRAAEELHLLAFREASRLLAVAPLMRSGDTLRFIASSDVCDFHEFVFEPSFEQRFYPALLDAVTPLPWRTLVLEGLPEDGPTLRLLPPLAQQRGLAIQPALEAVSPSMDLPGSWHAYVDALPQKDRHELRRKLRRLERAGRVSCAPCSDHTLAQDMDVFLELMRKSREDKAAFMTHGRERFFRNLADAMAREGLLKLFFLDLDGVRMASAFCFDYEGAYYLYNSGYDPQFAPLSVGLLLKALCLKDAIERGRRRFDFLRGPEPYKYDLGARDRRLFRLTAQREGPFPIDGGRLGSG